MVFDPIIPLFAFGLWMLVLYMDSKFRYFYEGKDASVLARGTKGVKRFLILRNRELKYAGVGLLWAGFSFGMVLAGGSTDLLSIVAYVVGLFGLVTYVVSRMWPFLSK